MLIGVKVKNFLSYKDEATLTLMASSIEEHRDINTFDVRNMTLLKNAVLYGKNASGKSNIFKALSFVQNFIINTMKMDPTSSIGINNFKLNEDSINSPSTFELSFIINNIIYKYGFTILNNEVQEEWLHQNIQRFTTLFHRKSSDGSSLEIGPSFKEGKQVPKNQIRKNGLFLPLVAVFNGEIATDIMKWIKSITIISGDRIKENHTIYLGEKKQYKEKIIDFLKIADLGIVNYNIEKEEHQENLNLTDKIMMHHNKYNSEYNKVGIEKIDMLLFESEGTKKYFSLIGPIIESLENGTLLIIDELDSKLHPLMVSFIIERFNSIDKNYKNSQLIINTHNTTILNKTLLRRDQIWFVDKNIYGESELYSLNEYRENKRVRNDEAFEKNYLLGKYGAIPQFYEEYLLNRDSVLKEE